MGLFGSLFTGVSALTAQSQSTAIISNNIANVNTTGYKRSEASFSTLVTAQNRSTLYSPGSVISSRIQRVDQQGPLQQAASSTDAAISGNGFFTVKRNPDDSSLDEFLYTRNGQFAEDAEGFLRNSAGFYLYGWPVDSAGEITGGQTVENLTPVSVGFATGQAITTANAEIAINLNGEEQDVSLANALTEPADFARTLTVFDSQGTAQSLVFNFVKTYGPQPTAVSSRQDLTSTSDFIQDLGLADGDSFTVAVNTPANGLVTRTYEIDNDATVVGANISVQTIGDVVEDINTNLAGGRAFLGNGGELIIQGEDFSAGSTVTITDGGGANDTVFALFGVAGTTGAITNDDLTTGNTYDNGAPGDSPPYSGETFPAFEVTDPALTTFNSRGWWQLEIQDDNNNTLTRGLLNFGPDGSLNAIPDSDGNIGLNIQNIDWGNGSDVEQDIFVDLEQLAQASATYTTFFTDQDGAELGLRTGLTIDEEGFVIAQFSNGSTAQLYRLPVATFANPNGLQEENGTAYVENEQSGAVNLRLAGEGGAGIIQNATLENSNVDLADEFAKLIVSQRAFSANTRVINTVDQMTEDLLRLR